MISGLMSSVVILGKTIRAPERLRFGTLQQTTQETSNFKYRALFRRLPFAVCQRDVEAELPLSL